MRERRTRGRLAERDLNERSLVARLLRPRGWLVQILFEVAFSGVAALVVFCLHGR